MSKRASDNLYSFWEYLITGPAPNEKSFGSSERLMMIRRVRHGGLKMHSIISISVPIPRTHRRKGGPRRASTTFFFCLLTKYELWSMKYGGMRGDIIGIICTRKDTPAGKTINTSSRHRKPLDTAKNQNRKRYQDSRVIKSSSIWTS